MLVATKPPEVFRNSRLSIDLSNTWSRQLKREGMPLLRSYHTTAVWQRGICVGGYWSRALYQGGGTWNGVPPGTRKCNSRSFAALTTTKPGDSAARRGTPV